MEKLDHRDPTYLFGCVMALEAILIAVSEQLDKDRFHADAAKHLEVLRVLLLKQSLPTEPMLIAVDDVQEHLESWRGIWKRGSPSQ